MPHQCTGCGHTFEDGSKEMLSGCPDCGGNKFQFRPASAVPDDSAGGSREGSPDPSADDPVDGPAGGGTDPRASSQPNSEASSQPNSEASPRPESGGSPPDDPEPDTSSVAETVGRATTRVRDFVSSGPDPAATESAETADPDPAAEWPDDWDTKPSESDRSPPDGSDRAETDADDPRRDADDPRRDGEIIDADARREAKRAEDRGEDVAQRSARSDVASPDEIDDHSASGADRSSPKSDLDQPSPAGSGPTSGNRDTDGADASAASQPDASPNPPSAGAPQNAEVAGEPTGEDPDLADLREQLNDQFESIKILEPGQYELNLMELYDREEYIIALQENGRYVIQVPEQWIGEDIDDR